MRDYELSKSLTALPHTCARSLPAASVADRLRIHSGVDETSRHIYHPAPFQSGDYVDRRVYVKFSVKLKTSQLAFRSSVRGILVSQRHDPGLGKRPTTSKARFEQVLREEDIGLPGHTEVAPQVASLLHNFVKDE